ncbi:MAG: hypothetical protein GXP28_08875 [Planctomycetes bacterium]|nr:hypothetical protein [Planctomycetota bacterium]
MRNENLAAMIVAGVLVATGPVHSQEVAQNEAPTESAEETRATIDLGTFQVKDLRPTRNETVKLSFAIHLALHPSVSQSTVEQLERWQHRLRDQVLIVIRLSATKDFLEPNLDKFRRSISLRVNRALKAILVSEALLTEFTFKLN